MSEEVKESILDSTDAAPEVKEDAPVVDKKEELSQEDLDWRQGLKDADLRVDQSLSKFKTMDDLAKSYKHLQSKLGERPIELNEESSYEDHLKVSEQVYKIEEKHYETFDEEIRDIAKKHKLPPEQFKNYLKDAEMAKKESEVKYETQKVEKYKEQILSKLEQEKFDVRFKAGLAALEMTTDEYKELMGSEALNPNLALKIAKLGEKQYDDTVLEIKEGKPGGLPSDPDFLTAKIKHLARQKMNAKLSGDVRAERDIESDLAAARAKFNSINNQ